MPVDNETGQKPGRLNVVFNEADQRRLLALHSVLQRRLGKRISYSVVVRYALERLAVSEKIEAA